MLANGLAMPPFPAPSCAPFELPAKGLSFGKETPPSPALCKATLVAIESKKPMAVVMPIDKAVLEGYLLCWLRSELMVSRWVDWRSEDCGELTGGRTCQHVSKKAAHL